MHLPFDWGEEFQGFPHQEQGAAHQDFLSPRVGSNSSQVSERAKKLHEAFPTNPYTAFQPPPGPSLGLYSSRMC